MHCLPTISGHPQLRYTAFCGFWANVQFIFKEGWFQRFPGIPWDFSDWLWFHFIQKTNTCEQNPNLKEVQHQSLLINHAGVALATAPSSIFPAWSPHQYSMCYIQGYIICHPLSGVEKRWINHLWLRMILASHGSPFAMIVNS